MKKHFLFFFSIPLLFNVLCKASHKLTQIKVPDCNTLHIRLANLYVGNFLHTTHFISTIADKNMTPLDICNTLRKAIAKYSIGNRMPLEMTTLNMKSHLIIAAILKEHPQEIENLEKQGLLLKNTLD